MPELQREAQLLRERIEAESATDAELRDVRVRVLERLEEPKPRRLWLPALAAAATTAALLAVVLWPTSESTWFEPIRGSECLVAESANAVSTESCSATIAVAEDRITLEPQTLLAREARALHLARGQATFQVKPRTETEFRVRISAGTIVVIGTAFTVEQAGGRGSVSVREGVVELRWNDGERERIRAGESRSWPRPEPVVDVPDYEAPEEPPEPARVPPDGKVKEPDVRSIMERLFQLRSQRRYGEAVRMLKKASRRKDLSRAQRERLSYEAGVVLRQAGHPDQACEHLRRHLKRFPDSPKREDVLNTCASVPSGDK